MLALGITAVAWSYWSNAKLHRDSSIPLLPSAIFAKLGAERLTGDPASLRWIDPPGATRPPWSGNRFVALLRHPAEPADVWLGRALLSPEGRLLNITQLSNLTDTSAVEEQSLTVSHERVAWSVADEGLVLSVHLADLHGRSLDEYRDWSAIDRAKMRITFLQDTGQLEGVRDQVFRLDPPRRKVALRWLSEQLELTDLPHVSTISPAGETSGTLGLLKEPEELGQPGDLVTWCVDRVRALSWFGNDRMQWLKTVAFSLSDASSRAKSKWIDRDGAEELRASLGDSIALGGKPLPDRETGWPPAALQPVISPPLAGEGEFAALDGDLFAVPPEGGSSPFAFTYLRADPSRPHSQVFIVAWDSRRLELHLMTGTREPKTATGETGPGKVPRTKEVMGRLAAAFNGGFQATHGEFGMMANAIVYLPPKPYAATVAELRDGSTGFGTWPNDDSIGPEYIGFRQNLTPLLADDKVNPYARTWWGGVPPGWEDATRTVRTGLCLTTERNIAYFYGSSIDSEHLALAMKTARCSYGIHLDMNPGHTGLEFYRVAPKGTLPLLERKLDPSWEARGDVADMSGWEFLGRRMIRSMHLMNFPRYGRTDSRDFLYLTHREILSKERLSNLSATPQPSGLTWQVAGLPHNGYPPALAIATSKAFAIGAERSITFAILDAKWMKPCRGACESAPVIATTRAPSGGGDLCVQHARRKFQVESCHREAVERNASATSELDAGLVVAQGRSRAKSTQARAAVGIADGQWLYYAEVTSGQDPAHDSSVLDELLTAFGCKDRVFLERPLALALNGGDRRDSVSDRITWTRDQTPFASRILQATPVVPFQEWNPLQAKRVRYKRQQAAPVNEAQATDVPVE